MNGSRTTAVRWSDETDQSQSSGLRDAAGDIQEEKSETRPTNRISAQRRIQANMMT